MAKNHRWIYDTCLKCGLTRRNKTKKIRMSIDPESFTYEQYYEYNDGIKTMDKRPDCK